MARIPYPALENIDKRLRPFYMGEAPLNILWLMGHAPNHADAAIRMSDAVLRRGELDPVLRQVALLRLCEVVGSPYERAQHEDVAEALGMSREFVEAAIAGSSTNELEENHQMACRLAEELAIAPRPSEPIFDYFAKTLSHREFVELVMGIGFYLMQSRLIETFDIELEEPRIRIPLELPDHEFIHSWRRGGI